MAKLTSLKLTEEDKAVFDQLKSLTNQKTLVGIIREATRRWLKELLPAEDPPKDL